MFHGVSPRNIDDLRAAANANLARLASGAIRREEAALRARQHQEKRWRIEFRRDLRKEVSDLRNDIVRWRLELDELRDNFDDLYVKFNAGETMTCEERGMLEEVDPRIDWLLEHIHDATRRIDDIQMTYGLK